MNKVIDMNAVEKNYGPVPVIQNGSSGRQRGRKDHADEADPGAAEGRRLFEYYRSDPADHVKQMEV